MGKAHTLALFGFIAAVLLACGPSPAEVCKKYVEKRKKEDWPADSSYQAACEKQLTEIKKKHAGTVDAIALCVEKSEDVAAIHGCIPERIRMYTKKSEQYPSDDEMELDRFWAYGIAEEASGAWAEEKGGKLSKEECVEGAYVVARRKQRLGLLPDRSTAETHQADILKSCEMAKDSIAYVNQLKCSRRVGMDKNKMVMCALHGTDK